MPDGSATRRMVNTSPSALTPSSPSMISFAPARRAASAVAPGTVSPPRGINSSNRELATTCRPWMRARFVASMSRNTVPRTVASGACTRPTARNGVSAEDARVAIAHATMPRASVAAMPAGTHSRRLLGPAVATRCTGVASTAGAAASSETACTGITAG